GSCLAQEGKAAKAGGGGAADDRHTLSNPGDVRVTHLDLDLRVEFDRRELAGVAILDVERQPGVGEGVPLHLDTRGLTIVAVGTRSSKGDPLKPFPPVSSQLGTADPILGSRLTIPLEPATQ